MGLNTKQIEHDPERQRFILETDAGPAYIEYRRSNDTLDLVKTFTPESERGSGIAARVTQQVLEHARENGLHVIPTCPYIKTYIKRNPEFKELVPE